ncbi:MAG: arylamine N-acetyltransferase [Opitutus sp.]|nr:arylamine N-acetyltransferase [Opitutus sp.]
MPALDLDAYLGRISYRGPRDVSLETLRALQWHHIRTIPFENLDVLLGRRIRIDLASIEQKLVRDRRGGYCFEQNHLFAAVLRALGFGVVPLAARVRWQVLPGFPTPLTHMLLLVECDGARYIADVGFGSMSLTAPLALDTDAEQPTPHEPRRLVRQPPASPADGGGTLFMQQARLGADWADVYQFSLQPQLPIDYELANWFTSTHPESRFRQNLTAARATDHCRHTILDREFTTRYPDGRVVKRAIASPDELLVLLAEYFDLHFPAGTRFGPPGSAWPS